MMRLGLWSLLLALCIGVLGRESQPPPPVMVVYSSLTGFNPSYVVIPVGGSVQWKTENHETFRVVQDNENPVFETPSETTSFVVNFDNMVPGTYSYHNDEFTHEGTVVVESARLPPSLPELPEGPPRPIPLGSRPQPLPLNGPPHEPLPLNGPGPLPLPLDGPGPKPGPKPAGTDVPLGPPEFPPGGPGNPLPPDSPEIPRPPGPDHGGKGKLPGPGKHPHDWSESDESQGQTETETDTNSEASATESESESESESQETTTSSGGNQGGGATTSAVVALPSEDFSWDPNLPPGWTQNDDSWFWGQVSNRPVRPTATGSLNNIETNEGVGFRGISKGQAALVGVLAAVMGMALAGAVVIALAQRNRIAPPESDGLLSNPSKYGALSNA